jgi:hypothetical protein
MLQRSSTAQLAVRKEREETRVLVGIRSVPSY